MQMRGEMVGGTAREARTEYLIIFQVSAIMFLMVHR